MQNISAAHVRADLSPWDGDRPIHKRVIVSRHEVQTGELSVVAAMEDIESPVDWCFEESHHTFVVHLSGNMDRMESVFSRGPASAVLPSLGDVWVIPAGCRYAALAQGSQVGFAEFRVPANLLGGGEISPLIGHRDPFLHHAAAKAAILAARTDDMAAMALEALLEALQYHFFEAYMRGSAVIGANSARTFALSQAAKSLLTEHIRSGLHTRLSLRELAALVGLSKTRLVSGFKASFGTTPWQYILRARIGAARNWLDHSNASISEIASATGFSSPSHLTVLFTRHVGTSPRQYRAIRVEKPR